MKLGEEFFLLVLEKKLQGPTPSLLPGLVIDITTARNHPILLADAEHLLRAQLNLHVAESRDRLILLFGINLGLW